MRKLFGSSNSFILIDNDTEQEYRNTVSFGLACDYLNFVNEYPEKYNFNKIYLSFDEAQEFLYIHCIDLYTLGKLF